jgi:hypothetical protein
MSDNFAHPLLQFKKNENTNDLFSHNPFSVPARMQFLQQRASLIDSPAPWGIL